MDRPGTSKSCGTSWTVGDPDFDDRVRRLLEEDEDNPDDPDEVDDVGSVVDDSDADPDYVMCQSEADESSSSDEDAMLVDDVDVGESSVIINAVAPDVPLPKYFLERMRKKEQGPPNGWTSKHPPRNVRTPARNILRGGLPGITGPARALGEASNKTEVWQLFFDAEIISKIVTNTNIKLLSVRDKIPPGQSKANFRNTNNEEVTALIGLLLLSSILKSNDETMESMFTRDEFSRPIFRATMSLNRYKALVGSLRFDDAQTREQRKTIDKAAAISEIFYKIISNSQAVYRPSAYVTIDEMLIPFRGRCSFRMYMPKKPKKYGIKVMCLADAKTSYLCNAYIYTGKGSDGVGLTEAEKNLSIPTQSVVRLCKVIEGTNRNVTADNWFSSVEGVDELRKRKLTYVGTLKKNKLCIPVEFLPNNDRPVISTLYGFRNELTLLSFVPKKNRAVCLLSSMHHTIDTNEEKNKPEIICFYNSTKAGVDLIDMKCAVYSSSRKTRRWPLAVFYRLINIASVNSFIVYMSYTRKTNVTRFGFIKSLAKELIVPHLQKRLTEVANLPRELKQEIQKILGNDAAPQIEGVPDDRLEKRKTCQKCPAGSDRKTQHKCIKCNLAICGQCQRRVCTGCAEECV
ncbi:piggyBac transposable element-derived protein 3-like [Macrosteles quadrilineatus]|uniref:piggyBac transposable element-derived protein 3-like n=1 Tax=Macrosteles quadrilineatus TaxID=74068 RepID=UPI0023E0B716|nr:piggyBac transposable element-derived protein 3-like [Macrosteles quadrilineatus]